MELDPNEHALHNAPFLWRTPEPKKSYEAIIVGGGGHNHLDRQAPQEAGHDSH